MNVEIINDASRWDGYAKSQPGSTHYHEWVWREIIEETFGHQGFYLAAVDGGEIQGVLPLVQMKSRLFGRSLVSVPFSSYGGILAHSDSARSALIAEAERLARELGVRHIEMRQGASAEVPWRDSTSKLTMEVSLPSKADALWNGLSSGMRNKVRNARKQGLRVEWGKTNNVDVFYRIFARNMRDLGTPVYPRNWFENLTRRMPEDVHIVTLWDEAEPVAAGLVIVHGGIAEFPWSSALRESRKKYSAVLMYWELLEWAVNNGYHTVDFGRSSPGSGTHEFKRHWGAKERPLHWYYWLARGTEIPGLHADNPKFRLATQVWRRLPVPLANWLGPHIVRAIP